jgi:ABC-2 type transport system ATP-binding protein/lipopolysaccharide transport system ATP-binding protein
MSEMMIKVSNVSMRFNLQRERVDSFKEAFIHRLSGKQNERNEFWALKEISFELGRGDSLGLVGVNGSGKSTLLKIIAGVMKPTIGKSTVFGKVAALIELGAGFDYDLTARENVFLNGAILGYSRAFMKNQLEEIIAFGELAEFIDVPIKNYSSGMLARLGFSIATIGDPDILIIDEILSVGDFRFQEKCEQRIKRLINRNTTVLFVSHSIEQVEKVCKRAIWLRNGQIAMDDEVRKVCEAYSHI